jgi:hypothetical protein
MTYRRRYLASLQHAPVVDLLLVDESNPRSVIYQLDTIGRYLAELPQAANGLRSEQERTVLGMLTALRLCDVERLCEEDSRGDRPALAALLHDLATTIPALSDSLSDRYLAHASVSRHLGYDDSVHDSALEPPIEHKASHAPGSSSPSQPVETEMPALPSRDVFQNDAQSDGHSIPPFADDEPPQEGFA